MERQLERAANFLPRAEAEAFGRNEVDGRVVSLTAPSSQAAEQYRTLYYRIEQRRRKGPLQVVGVTSAVRGEGKTVTAVNLATVSAQSSRDRRVVLVDADLRRGQIAAALGLKKKPGLAELLAGECEPDEAVRRFRGISLAVVPAGIAEQEPASLLAGGRMGSFLGWLRQAFDEVYVDVPPALLFADASILGCLCDGMVMVVRAQVTSRTLVHQALGALAGIPVIGCVLNGGDSTWGPGSLGG